MEKLIISKELAYDVKEWHNNITNGIKEIVIKHSGELLELVCANDFYTIHQVCAYLLGGQERVYEIKNDPHFVVWNTENKEFYTLPCNYPLEEDVEIVINTYDILGDAEETAVELNNSLWNVYL